MELDYSKIASAFNHSERALLLVEDALNAYIEKNSNGTETTDFTKGIFQSVQNARRWAHQFGKTERR